MTHYKTLALSLSFFFTPILSYAKNTIRFSMENRTQKNTHVCFYRGHENQDDHTVNTVLFSDDYDKDNALFSGSFRNTTTKSFALSSGTNPDVVVFVHCNNKNANVNIKMTKSGEDLKIRLAESYSKNKGYTVYQYSLQDTRFKFARVDASSFFNTINPPHQQEPTPMLPVLQHRINLSK